MSNVFRADANLVRLVAEAYRLHHAYLFNPIFATETSLIDPLPHQFIAVYEHLLKHVPLRFLLADDAGAGKTIMTGLYIQEALLRRQFDEAHKLSARYESDGTVDKSKRYELAERIAAQGKNLLLLTATPHMGKDDAYYFLWRLLLPEHLAAQKAFERLPDKVKSKHLLRRMKEEMITFDEKPIYPPRQLEKAQQELSDIDIREEKTGDEEEIIDGKEESEQVDEDLERATAARSTSELETEISHVQKLTIYLCPCLCHTIPN